MNTTEALLVTQTLAGDTRAFAQLMQRHRPWVQRKTWASAEAELWVVKQALSKVDGNVSEAAHLLGTNRNKVYRVLGREQVE
jgi:DNA-binding NtrC family response regulator